jgi:hypothetical protein
MSRIVRLAHRLLRFHRFEPCTLIDLAGYQFRGRACRCGVIDEGAWEWIGSVLRPGSAS